MSTRRHFLAVLTLGLVGAGGTGCESEERTRCARCGMYVDLSPGFAARAGARAYDTPKCLWRDVLAGEAEREEAVVTEYYSRAPLDAERAHYVVGSDIVGPMGPDLVPVAPENAARFAEEHGGRVVKPEAIDAALLERL